MRLIECVANFSEGTDAGVVNRIAEAFAGVNGCTVLDVTRDPDHNRAVVTSVGRQTSIEAAAFAGIQTASELIDLRKQSGVHPRIGAADVVPFVPIGEATLSECVTTAHRLGHRVWDELCIPVYFYEAAALRPERRRLEQVRRGEYELLRKQAETDPARAPDVGNPMLHPSAGGVIIGARKFLIAWNINLRTADVGIARAIARTIRESSGGLPCVKALGLYLASRNIAQVSMNLTDFEITPMQAVFDAVAQQADLHGIEIEETEIIGLLPRNAMQGTSPEALCIRSFRPSMIVENRIAGLGVADGQ